MGRHDHARSAVTALQAVLVVEGLLQRMQFSPIGHAFDGGDGTADAGGEEDAAGLRHSWGTTANLAEDVEEGDPDEEAEQEHEAHQVGEALGGDRGLGRRAAYLNPNLPKDPSPSGEERLEREDQHAAAVEGREGQDVHQGEVRRQQAGEVEREDGAKLPEHRADLDRADLDGHDHVPVTVLFGEEPFLVGRVDLGDLGQDLGHLAFVDGEVDGDAVAFRRNADRMAVKMTADGIHDLRVLVRRIRAKVWIVSPTTLMATLNTVRAVLKDARMREQAGLIQKEVRLLLDDIGRLDDRVTALDKHFGQAAEDIRQIRISTEKVTKRADRIETVQLGESGEGPAAEVAAPPPKLPGV